MITFLLVLIAEFIILWTQVIAGNQLTVNYKYWALVGVVTWFSQQLRDGAVMSSDGGLNWRRIYEGDALHDIYYDGLQVYAMTLGRGLLRSNDDGQSWENVQNQMGTPNLYTFEMQRVDDQLFAAQWYGVFRSSNSGNYWELLPSLPDSTAFASFFLSGHTLFAGAAMR